MHVQHSVNSQMCDSDRRSHWSQRRQIPASVEAHIAEISISGYSACGSSDVCDVGGNTESNRN